MTRNTLDAKLFPQGIPVLWCPVITPFSSPGVPDIQRLHALLEEIAPSVRGILIPGSTGEGWEMSDQDILSLLEGVLPKSTSLGQHLLIGALKPSTEETIESINSTLRWLLRHTGAADAHAAMDTCAVAGFTICPPAGSNLTQKQLCGGLESVLRTGVPAALYQLPQVTGNEIAPETVQHLAEKYENFFLFKDTSGTDTVSLSMLDFHGVFFVRGAEGSYANWHKFGGGPYDGFLLSTANSFSRELGQVLRMLEAGDRKEAETLSNRITACVNEVFPQAGKVGAGNAFANANKFFDHLRAWGPEAEQKPGPMLYGGMRLGTDLISLARTAMESNGFDLSRGYLQV